MSSGTPYDALDSHARKVLLGSLIQERYGPQAALDQEQKDGWTTVPPVTTSASTVTSRAISSSFTPTTRQFGSTTGASSAATTTPWEDEMTFKSLVELNETYQEDAAFRELRIGNTYVPGNGPNSKPKLFIVGEAPGAREQALGQPFIGASGKLLTTMLWELRVHRKDCYVTNVVKYRPPGNRKPTAEEMEASAPYLRDEIMLVYPKGGVVVLLGATALNVVDPDARVLAQQGKPFMRHKWTFVPMVHPSYVLQGRMKRELYAQAWCGLLPLLELPPPHYGSKAKAQRATGTEG